MCFTQRAYKARPIELYGKMANSFSVSANTAKSSGMKFERDMKFSNLSIN